MISVLGKTLHQMQQANEELFKKHLPLRLHTHTKTNTTTTPRHLTMAAIIASSVHLLPDLPFKTKASPLSIRPDSKGIFGHLSVDDTVLVRKCTVTVGDVLLPLQFGRIIGVHPTLQHVTGPKHPLSTGDKVAKPAYGIQFYPCLSPYDKVDIDPDMKMHDLPEVSESNLTLWVSSEDIIGHIFILHANDVTNQTFGVVSGRDNHLFVRSRAFFTASVVDCCLSYEYADLPQAEYNTFGEKFSTSMSPFHSPTINITERLLFSLKTESSKSVNSLYRRSKMCNRTHIREEYKSRESWAFESMALYGLVPRVYLTSQRLCVDENLHTQQHESGMDELDFTEEVGVGLKRKVPPNRKIPLKKKSRMIAPPDLSVGTVSPSRGYRKSLKKDSSIPKFQNSRQRSIITTGSSWLRTEAPCPPLCVLLLKPDLIFLFWPSHPFWLKRYKFLYRIR